MGKEIPIRSQICAPKDHVLIQCDLSGAEAWVVAYLADEPAMKEELAGGDLHSFTACGLFNIPFDRNAPMYDKDGKTKVRYAAVTKEKRYPGKRTNHSSNYMQGPFGLMEAFNGDGIMMITFAEAKRFQQVWQGIFPNVPGWWQRVREKMFMDRTLETVYGFKRTFYGPMGDDLVREAIAFEPQSTVGDHCLGAVQEGVNQPGGLLEFWKRHERRKHNKEVMIINTSHDSGLIQCHKSISDDMAHELANLMHRPLMINGEVFTIPVDCEIGERFGELEKYPIKLAA